MTPEEQAQQDEQERMARLAAQISPVNPNGPPGIALPSPLPIEQAQQTQIGESPDRFGRRQQSINSPFGGLLRDVAQKVLGQTPNQDITGPRPQQQPQQRPGSIRQALGQVIQPPVNGQPVVKQGGLRNLIEELLRIK